MSEGKCCDSITISLPKDAEEIQTEKMGTYKKEDSEKHDGKPVFTIKPSGLWKMFHTTYDKNEGDGWLVNEDTSFRSGDIRTKKQDTMACPNEWQWEYRNTVNEWVSSPKLEVKCDQSFDIPKEAYIGGCLFVALLLIVLFGCAFWSKYTPRDTTFEDDQIDDNPVYMYDYSDLDKNNEIYDTNAYYAATDVREGTTLVTDLNPEYESSL